MQITIDTSKDTPAHLLFIADFIRSFAISQLSELPPNFIDISSQVHKPIVVSPPSASTSAPLTTSPPADEPPAELLDSAGVAWNPEVHTANQSKNVNGTWRHKRTEKKPAQDAPQVVQVPSAPPPPPVSTVEPVPAVPPAPVQATPAVVVAPTPSAVPPAPPVSTVSHTHGIVTFADLVKKVTTLVGTKKLSTQEMLAACAECGVPDIHACQPRPEVIPSVATAILKRVKE